MKGRSKLRLHGGAGETLTVNKKSSGTDEGEDGAPKGVEVRPLVERLPGRSALPFLFRAHPRGGILPKRPLCLALLLGRLFGNLRLD